ncbi:hypothetical protein Q7C36_022133 [Tachysurus vachellii]|uniref:Secreted protein n=1 Tax=Tachysurus vachellii TaxID=175792 RepID=A0AA88LQ50_TACVA|nr:hypothetical protein Q7C36_022133 [Tachysurus vachellii]
MIFQSCLCLLAETLSLTHSFSTAYPNYLGSRGACAYLRRHRASRQDTPWTECQPITGHTHTHTLIHSHNHTLRTIIQRCQSTYHACLWTGGGNRSTRRKPPRHGENMQTPQTQGGGGNRTHNPGGVRQTC